MGYEFITQPQVFTSGITALGGIQGEVLKYPQIISYRSWTDTIAANTTSVPIPGSFAYSDSSEAYIVNIGGVVQFPNTYTITTDRKINFNSVLSAGIEYGVTLLATASPSSYGFTDITTTSGNIINLSAVNAFITNTTAENLLVTYLTALSSQLNIVNLTQYELSGFSVYGNANVHGNVIVSNLLSSLNATVTNTSATNLTALNLFIRRGGSIIAETSASTIDVGLINTRDFNLIHTPAGDGVNPVFNIGESNAGAFTGLTTTFEEGSNRAIITSRTGTVTLTSAIIDVNTGQVSISGAAAAGQALTVTGNVSAGGNLSVSRNITAENIFSTRDIYLTGDIIQKSNVTVAGSVTGPTTIAGTNDVYYTFTGDGNFTVNNSQGLIGRVLVVGGGGGGGGRYYSGGGGAGEVIDTPLRFAPGTYVIKVGAGGAGGSTDSVQGSDGVMTTFDGYIKALGGGGGGAYNVANGYGRLGANAGGNSAYQTTRTYTLPMFSIQGNHGGVGGGGGVTGGGGGGGAGSVGSNATNANGAAGGDGLASNITGTTVFYGGGGGGGGYSAGAGGSGGAGGGGAGATGTSGTPTAGTANTGSGGGGANNQPAGAAGGSGVVIIRYTQR
jgi:hypothetical protein